MRTRWLVLAAAALLALPASAVAGGWATVTLSSTPDGLQPGETWKVDLEILQHGRTPLDNVKPTIRIDGPGTTRTFHAKATGEPGMYRAEVGFDSAGEWTYEVDDGFSQTHSYPPIQIGAAAAPAVAAAPVERTAGTSEDGPPWLALGIALGVGLLVAATVRWRRA